MGKDTREKFHREMNVGEATVSVTVKAETEKEALQALDGCVGHLKTLGQFKQPPKEAKEEDDESEAETGKEDPKPADDDPPAE